MKRSLLLILLLGLMLVFAACSNNDNMAPASDTDIDPEYVPPVKDQAQLESELQSVEEALGIHIDMAGEYEITGYEVSGDTQAQVSFVTEGNNAIGRAAKGKILDMLGITREFAVAETVEVKGLSAAARYADAEDHAMYAGDSLGVIEAYDEEGDMSYAVVIFSNATGDMLAQVLGDLIDGTTLQ